MEIAIAENEVPAMDYAGPRVVGPGKYLVLDAPRDPNWEPIPGGEPTLELYFDTDNLDEARSEAEGLYAQMREESRLEAQPARVLGSYFMTGDEPLAEHFVDEAFELLDQQRNELAVVAAQVACEVEIRSAIERVASAETGSLARIAIDAPSSYSLMDRRARRIFEVVLGAPPTEAPCWQKYAEHVRRRNNIVHRGAQVTHEDADTSVDVAIEMLRFVRGLVQDAR